MNFTSHRTLAPSVGIGMALLAELPDPRQATNRAERLASDVLPLADLVSLLGSAWLIEAASRWDHPEPGAGAGRGWVEASSEALGWASQGGVEGLIPLAWIAATLALFLLYDPDFGASALRPAPSFGAHAARFGALAAATFGIGSAAHLIQGLPVGLALGWLLLAWSMTLLWRLFAAAQLGRRAGATGAKGLGPRPVLQEVGGYLKVEMRAERPIARANAWLKAAEDTLLGGLATLLLLPLLALIAVAIKLDSPGPVLFTQRRHGLNNDEFDIFKFRSMRSTEGGAHQPLQQTLRGDSRVTRVGRFLRASSLDELPQLLNVLLGQMSLVGPRPHAIDMRTQDLLGPEIAPDYAHRHRVKPGITGWAQVNGARGATHTTGELARRIELDLDYIAHWSLGLDLKIMLMTVRTVIGARNAF